MSNPARNNINNEQFLNWPLLPEIGLPAPSEAHKKVHKQHVESRFFDSTEEKRLILITCALHPWFLNILITNYYLITWK